MALTVDHDRLEADVPVGARVCVDTSAVVAYIRGGEPASGPATWLFDGRIAQGRNSALISAVTAAEILVGPFREGRAAVAIADGFLSFFGEVVVVPVDHAIARSAAGIRASSGLSLPDALVLATALASDATIVATNDQRWVAAATTLGLPLSICMLGSYANEAR